MPRGLRDFRKLLLAWFHRNKRDLPWRNSRDAYRIWISEIMLQQTRVAAVIPYYEKFLAQFPDVESLAAARIEKVLRFWAGLGYYSRARNLHKAARQISERHAGNFPRQHAQALSLAGIGNYTAAAVLSIAYDAPHAVLDGNVARVLARLGAIHGDLREPKRWTMLSDAAQTLLAPRDAGDWNQAMMELGATVCTPRTPNCGACPIANYCRARSLGIQNEIPAKRIKRADGRHYLSCGSLFGCSRPHTPNSSAARRDYKARAPPKKWQSPRLSLRIPHTRFFQISGNSLRLNPTEAQSLPPRRISQLISQRSSRKSQRKICSRFPPRATRLHFAKSHSLRICCE